MLKKSVAISIACWVSQPIFSSAVTLSTDPPQTLSFAQNFCSEGSQCDRNLFFSRLFSGVDGNVEMDLYDPIPQEELLQSISAIVKKQVQNGEDVDPEIAQLV